MDLVFSCPHCGDPGASFEEESIDLHCGAGYRCNRCSEVVYLEPMSQEEYLEWANSAAWAHHLEKSLRRIEKWMRGSNGRCCYYVEEGGKEANCGAPEGEPHHQGCVFSVFNKEE